MIAKLNGQTYSLGRPDYINTIHIGNGPKNTVRIPDKSISDRHIEIYRKGDGLMLKNIGTSAVAVNGTQRSESNLRDAKRNTEQELGLAIQAQQQAAEALETFWKDEGSKGKDYISWAVEESKKDSNELGSMVSVLNKVLPAIGNAINIRSRFNTTLAEHDTAEKARKEAEEALTKAVERQGDPNITGSLIATLEDAKKYLDETDSIENCPVCQTKVQPEELKQKVQEHLDSLNELVELKKKLETAQRNTASKVTLVRQAKTELLNSMKTLAGTVKDCGIRKIEELGVEWEKLEESGDSTQSEEILKLSHEALDLIVTCEDSLKGSQQETQKTLTQLNSIKRHLQTVQEKARSVSGNLTKELYFQHLTFSKN